MESSRNDRANPLNAYRFSIAGLEPGASTQFSAELVGMAPQVNVRLISVPSQWFAAGNSLEFNFINDLDGDGIPDWWEATHGLSPLDIADAIKDTDGDGISNMDEYQSGTSPLDPASQLRIGLTPDP